MLFLICTNKVTVSLIKIDFTDCTSLTYGAQAYATAYTNFSGWSVWVLQEPRTLLQPHL